MIKKNYILTDKKNTKLELHLKAIFELFKGQSIIIDIVC